MATAKYLAFVAKSLVSFDLGCLSFVEATDKVLIWLCFGDGNDNVVHVQDDRSEGHHAFTAELVRSC